MAQNGNVFAALLQFLVTVGTTTGVYFALVSKQRWLIYIALVAYIGFVAISSK